MSSLIDYITAPIHIAVARTGLFNVSLIVLSNRDATCRNCAKSIPCKQQAGKKCWCAECGCAIKDKNRLMYMSCPIGLYPKVRQSNAIDLDGLRQKPDKAKKCPACKPLEDRED